MQQQTTQSAEPEAVAPRMVELRQPEETPELDYAICTPYWGGRDGDHLDCITALQKRYGLRGYRLDGCAYIDIARAALCRMVEANGHAGALFIDHDILFNPDDAYELCVAAERTGCVVS